MTHATRFAVAAVLALSCHRLALAQPAPPPTMDAVRAAADAGDCQQALRLVAQVLQLRGPESQNYDRGQLLTIRGDCLMKAGDGRLAAEAYEAASGYYDTDPKKRADLRALAVLGLRAQRGFYRPAGGEPIDVRDPASHPSAFGALLAELTTANQAPYNSALGGNSLPAMRKVLPAMLDQATVERAATGSAQQTVAQLATLGEKARGLMKTHIDQSAARVRDIGSSAAEVRVFGGYVNAAGLNTTQTGELEAIRQDISQLALLARTSRTRVRELGGSGEAWEPIIADASDVVHTIEAMVARYAPQRGADNRSKQRSAAPNR